MAEKTSDWRPGPTVCRCCLAEGCYKDISTEYFWMGKREVYAEMLSDTLSVSIAYSQSGGPNSNSRLICESCISRLRDATDFKRQVLECEKTFMNLLDPGSSTLVKELQLSMEEVKVEHVKTEKASMSDDDFDDQVDFVVENDDDDDDDLDDEPLMKLASKEPKKEVNITELLKNSQVTVKRKAAVKAKAPPAKKAKKQIVIKPTASKAAAKATASSTPKTEKKKKGPTFQLDLKADPRPRKNAAIILECSNVCSFKWLRNKFACAYCDFTSVEFGPIRIHTLDHKPKTRAQIRAELGFSVNIDVTDLECEICNEAIKDLSALINHLVEAHGKPLAKECNLGVTPYLLNNGFQCYECGKTFEHFRGLGKHVNEHYHNYVCSQCGLGFSGINRLRSHMTSHKKKRTEFKCTMCDEVFPSICRKRGHMISEHDMKAYKCPYCSEQFKGYSQRRQHLKEQHSTNINYPCKYCPAVLSSSSSRARHMRRTHYIDKKNVCTVCSDRFVTRTELKDHMIKHTSKKSHICHVCHKYYSRRRTLKQHMRLHENDKRFVCEHCNNAFVQKCTLKNHMKSHHLDLF